MAVAEVISSTLIQIYSLIQGALPIVVGEFISLFLIALLVFVYALFIWKFYRSVSKKNILELNLNQYNRSSHPSITKFFAALFYIIEYIIILPFLIFFWFVVFTLFLILLTEGISSGAILLIAATIIAAIRMTAYYNQELSQDVSKLLPLTLLALAVTNPGFFNIEIIIGKIAELTPLANQIFAYLIFIIFLEIILRIFDLIFNALGISDDEENIKRK